MARPRILRLLRIAFSAACGIVCLLLIALWVRSYSWRDSIWMVANSPAPAGLTHIRFSSNSGELFRVRENALYSLSLQVAKRDHWQYDGGVAAEFIPEKFHWLFSQSRQVIAIPHWFGALVSAAFCMLTSPLIRWRFSLRTLLIATTLIAGLLGLVVALR